MTEQEAIEVLEKPSVHIKPVHRTENGTDFLTYSAYLVEAFEMAIKTLEKQIAKKIDVWANGEEHCPCCDKNLTTFYGFANCFACGQKLDWGNEDAE